jgi:hypothetical protein
LEYKLVAATPAERLAWAQRWHALGTLAVGSAAYNVALQAITDRFAGPGGRLGQLRTNEIALASPWQLREFHLNTTTHRLVESTAFRTPDNQFNNTATLANFVNTNAAAILAGTHTVPLSFAGAPFRANDVTNNIDFWTAPGITNNTARHLFSLNTCNGCHGAETNTFFLQVQPRAANTVAQLAGFLTGETITGPDGVTRTFNDLARRRTDLRNFLCAPPMSAAAEPAPLSRTH